VLLAASPVLAGCVVGAIAGPLTADGGGSDTTFTWARELPSGALLAVQDGNGAVEVRETSGTRAEVVAVVTVIDRSRGASTVELGVEESSAGVTLCTLYDGARRCSDAMRPVNVRVRFTVLLPRGLRLVATTGNGEIAVSGAAASLVATTGNGRITVADARGPVVASTGNGDIELRQGDAAVAGTADATLTSGNGAITATLPAAFRGRVEASTGNGVVRSDFPVAMVGVIDARHLAGSVGGGGGALLRMTTGNGSVTLRKG
jgi:hypothetical protein